MMEPTFFATPAHLRVWLEEHHETRTELLVGFYKKGSGKPSITWPESVDEALCFGWIDGVRRSLGEDAYSIRFTPRKPTSIWSAVNVRRVAALTELGRMRPAGERAFAARRADRTAIYSGERAEPAELPAAQRARIRATRKATAFFEAQAPWYQRTAKHWVVSAKREETRERRFAELLADSASGKTLGHLTRPGSKRGRAR
ncbi:MAG: YdeI/OmpD-associated family protein [Polyangiales bacterium]